MMPLEDSLYISGKPSHLVTYHKISLTGLGWDKFTGYYDPTEFDVRRLKDYDDHGKLDMIRQN